MDADKKITLPRIRKLPDSVANQIAAGEVVERPASVVKELLENSIDAQSTSVEVDIEKGGTQKIRVRDDGHGIHQDDIELALERHATSKLHKLTDLECINSLGFRGEALPSIASVSQFKLVSRRADVEQGWSVTVDSLSNRLEHSPASHPVGTTVEVNNLFHVTPARRKFLRSERTEFLHILEMIKRLALGNPEVSVRLRHNDKQVLYCPHVQGDPAERMASIMGASFSQKAMLIDYSDKRMRLWGWLGLSDLSRNQSDRQYFYLNGRMIRDKRVSHAIRLAYESRIQPGRYPCYVLYLEMDVAAADVNVHPTKHEVRFRHARDVHDFIYASLDDGLNQADVLNLGETEQNNYASTSKLGMEKYGEQLSEISGDYSSLMSTSKGKELLSSVPRAGRPIAHLRGRFIITEIDQKFGLIDVSAARKYIAKMRLRGVDGVAQRPLLVPVTLSFSESDVTSVLDVSDSLRHYGLILEAASPTSLMVKSIPMVLQDVDIQLLINDILVVLRKNELEGLVDVMAEHANDIQENDLSTGEMLTILRALDEVELDRQKDKAVGIWRYLSLEDFASLLNTHG